PAVELSGVALLNGQLLGQDTPARAVRLRDDGTPGPDIDVAPARQVGAELGVADEQVGRFVVVGPEEPRAESGDGGDKAEEVAPRDDRVLARHVLLFRGPSVTSASSPPPPSFPPHRP